MNTCIFKENLKVIISALVESIWKDRVRADKIQETIKSAYNEIYRGEFEEIKEVDEEQMYNSWMNSKSSVERVQTESGLNSAKTMHNRDANEAEGNITGFCEEDDKGRKITVSEIYDRNDDAVNPSDNNVNIKNESNVDDYKEVVDDNRDKNCTNKNRIKKHRTESENFGKTRTHHSKLSNNHKGHNNENSLTENQLSKYVNEADSNKSLSEHDITKPKCQLPTSTFRELNKKHMRSFDSNGIQSMRQNLQIDNTTDNDIKNINPKFSETIRGLKRSNLCFKEQYYTNVQNHVKKEKKNCMKTDFIDQKLKQSIKYSINEGRHRLIAGKLKARNRSANSIHYRSYTEDLGSVKNDVVKTNKKMKDGAKGELSLHKTELYR